MKYNNCRLVRAEFLQEGRQDRWEQRQDLSTLHHQASIEHIKKKTGRFNEAVSDGFENVKKSI